MPLATSVSITEGSHSSPPISGTRKTRAPAVSSAAASVRGPQKSQSGCSRALSTRRLCASPSRLRPIDDAHRRPVLEARQPAGQQWIVIDDGLAPDEDCIGTGAQEVSLRARFRARRPCRLTVAPARHLSLGVECELHLYKRTALGDAQDVAGRHPVRLARHRPAFHRDARGAQPRQPAAGNARVGILDGADDAADAGSDDGVGARRRGAVMRAGLQRHVQGRPARLRPRAAQGFRLRVRTAAAGGDTARDHLSGRLIRDDGADGRVWRRGAQPALREPQGNRHHVSIKPGTGRRSHETLVSRFRSSPQFAAGAESELRNHKGH